MSVVNRMHVRSPAVRVIAVLFVVFAFAGCKKDQATATPGTATTPATTQDAPPPPAVSDKVNAMSADQLREAASKALREQRLYAPAGDNAMEYYLALRDKQPDAPAVSSALTDLMPYVLIATEQSIAREDFTEAQRMVALMEKTDAKAPALPRLKKAVADGQEAAVKRAEQQKVQTEEDAKRQADLEKQRATEQQKAQQDAAQKLAAEQQAEKDRASTATAATAPPPAPANNPPPATTPTPPPAPQVSNTLRPISTPAPNYPREAERRRRSGEVEVEYTVGVDGSVTSARVVHASPPRVFDRETLSAVNRWRFQPVGQPVTSRRTIQFKPPN